MEEEGKEEEKGRTEDRSEGNINKDIQMPTRIEWIRGREGEKRGEEEEEEDGNGRGGR